MMGGGGGAGDGKRREGERGGRESGEEQAAERLWAGGRCPCVRQRARKRRGKGPRLGAAVVDPGAVGADVGQVREEGEVEVDRLGRRRARARLEQVAAADDVLEPAVAHVGQHRPHLLADKRKVVDHLLGGSVLKDT